MKFYLIDDNNQMVTMEAEAMPSFFVGPGCNWFRSPLEAARSRWRGLRIDARQAEDRLHAVRARRDAFEKALPEVLGEAGCRQFWATDDAGGPDHAAD